MNQAGVTLRFGLIGGQKILHKTSGWIDSPVSISQTELPITTIIAAKKTKLTRSEIINETVFKSVYYLQTHQQTIGFTPNKH